MWLIFFLKEILQTIHRISKGKECTQSRSHVVLSEHSFGGLRPETIASLTRPLTNYSQFETTWKGVEFLSRILSKYNPKSDDYKMMRSAVNELIQIDANIYRLRVGWLTNEPEAEPDRKLSLRYFEIDSTNFIINEEESKEVMLLDTSWIPKSLVKPLAAQRSVSGSGSEWSSVYYDCDLKLWFISYTALILTKSERNQMIGDYDADKTIRGVISADIDISGTDINQCESNQDLYDQSYDTLILTLWGTHKCHSETSQVSVNRCQSLSIT